MLLGDGECDGTQLLAALGTAGCEYVCRSGITISITAQDRLFPVGNLPLKRGQAVAIADVQMTQPGDGPLRLLGIWETKQDRPSSLVTSVSEATVAADC